MAHQSALLILVTLTLTGAGCLQKSGPEETRAEQPVLLPSFPLQFNATGPTWGAVFDIASSASPICAIDYAAAGSFPRSRPTIMAAVIAPAGAGLPTFVTPGQATSAVWTRATAAGVERNTSNGVQGWEAAGSIRLQSPADASAFQVLILARDLENPGGDADNFTIDCEKSSVTRVATSRNVWIFDLGDLAEGIGVQESAAGGTGGLHARGHAAWTLQGANVSMGLLVDGDLLTNHVAAGTLDIRHPGGSDQWIVRPRQTAIEYGAAGSYVTSNHWRTYAGGPGQYSLDASFATVQPFGLLKGYAAAWDPQASAGEGVRDDHG